jgi:hypothetical protein
VPVEESVNVNAVIVCIPTVGADNPDATFNEFVALTPIEMGKVAVAPLVPKMLIESVPAVVLLNQTGVPTATFDNPILEAD